MFIGTQVFRWKAYILTDAENAGSIVCSSYRSRKILIRTDMIYIYKSQIKPKMVYSPLSSIEFKAITRPAGRLINNPSLTYDTLWAPRYYFTIT